MADNIERRSFHTLDLVSVYTGILVSPRGAGALYEVCGYLLSDQGLMTHQLSYAADACMPAMLEQHPWLGELDPPLGDMEVLATWCDELISRVGVTQWVTPIEGSDWTRDNALHDLLRIMEERHT